MKKMILMMTKVLSQGIVISTKCRAVIVTGNGSYRDIDDEASDNEDIDETVYQELPNVRFTPTVAPWLFKQNVHRRC